MRLNIKGQDFEILGDPHLGRSFRNGVPLHRLGDREKMQRADFQQSLARGREDDVIHVCMGDLFDKPKVDNRFVLEAAQDYLNAAGVEEDFIVLTGNHDEMRDRDFVSSFRLFTEIVQEHVWVIRSIPLRRSFGGCAAVFIPWHPLKTALELVDEHVETIRGADVVFGHWDVDRRLEGTDNYIPAERFVELGVGLAITGHDHTARETTVAGLPVIVTGSMQPYSHSEDPGGKLYQTLPADGVRMMLESDPDWFKDMCLRVVGDWDDEVPNCLQFKVVAAGAEDVEEALEQVQIAEFSMSALFDQAFVDVDPVIAQDIKAKFAEIGGEDE